MILHHIFEDLIEGFEPMRPPQPSKKTYFLKILKIFLKIVKSWGVRGGVRDFKPSKMILHIIIHWYFYLRLKGAIFTKKSVSENMREGWDGPLPQKGLMLVKIFYFIYIPIFHSENENLQYSWGQAIFQLIISLSQSF